MIVPHEGCNTKDLPGGLCCSLGCWFVTRRGGSGGRGVVRKGGEGREGGGGCGVLGMNFSSLFGVFAQEGALVCQWVLCTNVSRDSVGNIVSILQRLIVRMAITAPGRGCYQ